MFQDILSFRCSETLASLDVSHNKQNLIFNQEEGSGRQWNTQALGKYWLQK